MRKKTLLKVKPNLYINNFIIHGLGRESNLHMELKFKKELYSNPNHSPSTNPNHNYKT